MHGRPRLVGIPTRPQRPSEIDVAIHPRVASIEQGMGAVLLRMIECYALLQMGATGGQLSHKEQGHAQGPVRFEKERRGSLTLGQPEELLAHFASCLQLRPHDIKPP